MEDESSMDDPLPLPPDIMLDKGNLITKMNSLQKKKKKRLFFFMKKSRGQISIEHC